jgi:CRISPR/Cas system-associated protein Csm6
VTNNIAAIEPEANEALSENRRELAEETAKINSEPDLSEEAKVCYVGEAREHAQAKYAESALLKTQDA